MKHIQRILATIFVILLFVGCAVKEPTDHATEVPAAEGPTTVLEYSLYLPDDAPYEFTGEIEPGQTVYLDEIICTNTTEISVKNTGKIPLTCNLYYPDDTEYVIQTHTVQPGKTGEFGGLTSRFTYCLGFQSEESGTIEVIISG